MSYGNIEVENGPVFSELNTIDRSLEELEKRLSFVLIPEPPTTPCKDAAPRSSELMLRLLRVSDKLTSFIERVNL